MTRLQPSRASSVPTGGSRSPDQSVAEGRTSPRIPSAAHRGLQRLPGPRVRGRFADRSRTPVSSKITSLNNPTQLDPEPPASPARHDCRRNPATTSKMLRQSSSATGRARLCSQHAVHDHRHRIRNPSREDQLDSHRRRQKLRTAPLCAALRRKPKLTASCNRAATAAAGSVSENCCGPRPIATRSRRR